MTQLTFYPLGNADTSLIELHDGRRILVDYANKKTDSPEDRRCDLPTLLKADLKNAGRDRYSVVAFTHLDDDHCKGASEFFHFDHAAAYQGDGRPKIDMLWVPALAVVEEGLEDSARVIRQEARYRLKRGSGIKVFSRPERLQSWFAAEKLSMEDRLHCLVDAGQLVPGFDLDADQVEFFAHSPHAKRSDELGLEDRNGGSLFFQVRLHEDGYNTDVLYSGDVTHEVLAEIVDITRYHGNDDRLHWNVYHLPHHCSYTAIGPEKGDDKTAPTPQVEWLCEIRGEPAGYVISPSDPIPAKTTGADRNVQPPHREAAEYYRTDVLNHPSHLLVTMEEPSILSPRPIVLKVTRDGAIPVPPGSGGSRTAAAVVAPRAG